MDNQFTKFKGLDPDCDLCHGEGSYMYDDNHGKICEKCCTHPEGFHSLDPVFFGDESREYDYCAFGCGAKKHKTTGVITIR